MYPVLQFRPSTDFHVSVPHDVPSGIAREVGVVVRRVLHHLTGVWKVTAERSPERGRWRVELRGPAGRHIWTFLGPCEALPENISQKLGAFIRVATIHYLIRARATSWLVAPDAPPASRPA
jgi:hypothetical protein